MAPPTECFVRNKVFRPEKWKDEEHGEEDEYKGETRSSWKVGGPNLNIFVNKQDFDNKNVNVGNGCTVRNWSEAGILFPEVSLWEDYGIELRTQVRPPPLFGLHWKYRIAVPTVKSNDKPGELIVDGHLPMGVSQKRFENMMGKDSVRDILGRNQNTFFREGDHRWAGSINQRIFPRRQVNHDAYFSEQMTRVCHRGAAKGLLLELLRRAQHDLLILFITGAHPALNKHLLENLHLIPGYPKALAMARRFESSRNVSNRMHIHPPISEIKEKEDSDEDCVEAFTPPSRTSFRGIRRLGGRRGRLSRGGVPKRDITNVRASPPPRKNRVMKSKR